MENLIPSRLLKTRRGTIAVGIGAAVLAAILLLVYLRSYRSSVKGSSEPMTVLVAKRLIPRGTSGAAVATKNLYVVTSVPKGDLKLGAISDAGALRGTVAATDIYPSQQLTSADFTSVAGGALASQLTTTSRAIALPSLKDAAHGLAGAVQPGDHVDIYGQLDGANSPAGPNQKVLATLLRNVQVLSTPTSVSSGAVTGSYVLKVPSDQVARVAYMAENGTIWFVLRPSTGAKGSHPAFVTSGNIFAGRRGQGITVLGGGD